MFTIQAALALYFLVNTISALFFCIKWRRSQSALDGLQFFSLGSFFCALSALLIALRPYIPPIFSYAVANGLYVWGGMLLLKGMARFKKQPVKFFKLHYVLIATIVLLYSFWEFVDLRCRIVITCLILSYFAARSALILFKAIDIKNQGAVLRLGIIFTAYSLLLFFRGIDALLLASGTRFLESGSIQTLYLHFYSLFSLLILLGFIPLIKRHLEDR